MHYYMNKSRKELYDKISRRGFVLRTNAFKLTWHKIDFHLYTTSKYLKHDRIDSTILHLVNLKLRSLVLMKWKLTIWANSVIELQFFPYLNFMITGSGAQDRMLFLLQSMWIYFRFSICSLQLQPKRYRLLWPLLSTVQIYPRLIWRVTFCLQFNPRKPMVNANLITLNRATINRLFIMLVIHMPEYVGSIKQSQKFTFWWL